MKRIIAIIAAIALLAIAAVSTAEGYTIGIGQFAQHGSLDNCYEGFVAGLAEAGIVEGENLTIDLQNAQADMGIAQQIAAQFAAANVDMMVGIATPMAQACFNAAEGLDYIALGRQTGLMAAKVLKGEAKASEIPYEIITEPGLYVNSAALESFGIVLSDELAARAIEAE